MAQTNLKKLAGQLASAYHKVSWPDVEDDVSLCVWVRKECGEELTVKQAGRLRTAMESLIAESADEKSELFVTKDFDGDGWDVWFPSPLGGRQVLESFATKGEADAFADDQRRSAEG
ncbi:MAG: hypothetical protein K2V38_26400 [Gemmataceae bacterium]|nr:hypothetical protein [Gemmataceae bacterium]